MNEKLYQGVFTLRVEKTTAFYLVNYKIKFRRHDRLLIMNFSYMSTWCGTAFQQILLNTVVKERPVFTFVPIIAQGCESNKAFMKGFGVAEIIQFLRISYFSQVILR